MDATVTKQNFFAMLADSRTKANQEFAKASNPKKRVMIARDVIKAIDVGTFRPTKGTYVGATVYQAAAGHGNGPRSDDSLQATLANVPDCNVCAKGAIFLCMVGRRNKVTHRDLLYSGFGDYEMHEQFDGIFGAEQLGAIERAFEAWTSESRDQKYKYTPEQRLRAIMENIVRNDGWFVPNMYGGVDVDLGTNQNHAQARDRSLSAALWA